MGVWSADSSNVGLSLNYLVLNVFLGYTPVPSQDGRGSRKLIACSRFKVLRNGTIELDHRATHKTTLIKA